MRKEKTRCYDPSKELYCIMYNDNTITLGEDHWREGGDLVNPDWEEDADKYLKSIDYYMNQYKKEEPVYYSRILKMLRKHGFEYEPWKTFIRASENYIWEPIVEMTKEEIEAALGYKIKIKESK